MGGWVDDEAAPLALPLVFPLTLNIGFGIETDCDFAVLADWRLSTVDPDDLFFAFSNADLDIFLGCFSDARNL